MRSTISLLVLALSLPALGQPAPPAPLTITRASGGIDIDGNLTDAAWQTATKIDRFYETSPGDNTEPKVKTTAWITYDEKYFYIAVRSDDPNPNAIRAPFVDRDQVIGTDDNIAIFLDTRNDKRTALELRVNPRGVQADGIFNDAGPIEDFSPDYFYDTAAKIDAGGWSAEFRIPFSSLRYSDAPEQTWNILVWRNYPREYRYAYQSVPIPRGSNCYMCFMQPIVGLTNLPKAGDLVLAPYATVQQVASPKGPLGSALENDDAKFDGGLDLKWTPSADHAVDLTINPDFSQVETDVAEITVNQRFAVFFPEKRPFFLEGFDLFDTPMTVAYTRTITDPAWGIRSTGKFGSTAYTAIVAGDQGGGLTIIPGPLGSDFALQDFKSTDTIARVRHDLGASFIGAVLTSREIRGGGHNRVIGPDFQWRPTQSDSITGELLLSSTENPNLPNVSGAWDGESSTSHAFFASWNHVKEQYDWFAQIRDLGEDFRADLGFIPQVGYRQANGGFGLRRFYEQGRLGGLIRFFRPSVSFLEQRDRDGETIQRTADVSFFVQGRKNLTAELVVRPEEKVLVGGKLLSQSYVPWFIQFDPSRRFPRITLNGRLGDFIDFNDARVGTGGNFGITATLRPIDRITVDLTSRHEWLDAASQRVYTADVQRVKATYSFSNKSLIRAIGQYVTTDSGSFHSGDFLGSILYSYKINWQTVLYAGYGDERALTVGDELVEAGRSFFLKVSYAWQR